MHVTGKAGFHKIDTSCLGSYCMPNYFLEDELYVITILCFGYDLKGLYFWR
jgi:hypothetical protein